MVTASCNCGAVAFELTTEPDYIYVCHCSICRRYTGAANIPVILVPRSDFHWLRGEDQIQRWRKPDADWEAHFCRTCGSPLPGENDAERMFIPAGLLVEGADQLSICDHIFVGSKAPWEAICDSGRQHLDHYQE